MPRHGSGTTRRRRTALPTAGTFIAALSLALSAVGSAQAATGTATPPDGHSPAKIKRGEASMGVGVRMHEGDSTDGSRPHLSATVEGVDVSGHQGDVNWSGLAGSGAKWAYVKATESTNYTNEYFTQQYNGSYGAGMIRGAYHFATPDTSGGAAQATYFLAHGGGWSKDGKTLPGALDIEYNPYGATCYGLSQSAMVSWIKDFVSTYKAKTGRDPVIYTTTDWWSQCTGNNGGFGGANPLWVARYASSPGALPGGWGFYTMWQYTSTGPTVGDHSVFNGAYDRLQALANG